MIGVTYHIILYSDLRWLRQLHTDSPVRGKPLGAAAIAPLSTLLSLSNPRLAGLAEKLDRNAKETLLARLAALDYLHGTIL